MRFAYWRALTLRGQRWRWNLRAANNRIIATSGEDFQNKADCLHAISLVQGSGGAVVEERR